MLLVAAVPSLDEEPALCGGPGGPGESGVGFSEENGGVTCR